MARELIRLREGLDELRVYLDPGDCPCCEASADEKHVPGCTFENDCPMDFDRYEATAHIVRGIRALLDAEKGGDEVNACPVCGGDGARHDEWTGTIDRAGKCPACSGTGKGPQGCQSPGLALAAQRQRATRAAHNQYRPWTPASDAMIQDAEARWRRRGKKRRPGTWYEDVSAQLAEAFPEEGLRTPMSIRIRIGLLRRRRAHE